MKKTALIGIAVVVILILGIASSYNGLVSSEQAVRAQWGRHDAAIAALGRARELGDSGLIYARNDPFLDPLRDDARFVELLNRLGFD